MAVEFERLVVYMDARLADYEKALAKARGQTTKNLSDMERRFQQAEKKISGFGKSFVSGLASGIAGTLGVGGLVGMATAALEMADNLSDAAAQLGVTTTALQALQYGARQTGVDVGTLDSALDQLSKGIGEAATGDKTKLAQFKALGVDLKDAAGNARPLVDVLEDVAQAISQVGDRQQQAAAMNDIFGRSGTRLLPLLEEIAGGMGDLTKSAEEAGQVMSEDTVRRLAAANDAIEEWTISLKIWFAETISSGWDINEVLANVEKQTREATDAFLGYAAAIGQAAGEIANVASGGLLGEPGTRPSSTDLTGLGILGGGGGGGLNTSLGGTTDPARLGLGVYSPPRGGGGGSAEAAAKRAAEARAQAIQQLGEELKLNAELVASYSQGEAVLDGLRAAYDAVNDARKLGLEGDQLKAFLADRQSLAAEQARLDLLKEGASLTEALRTEEEQRADVIARLNELRDAGVITEETYRRGLEQTNLVLEAQRDIAEDVVGTLFGGMLAAAQQGQGLKGVLDSINQSLSNIAGRLADKALNKLLDLGLNYLFGGGGNFGSGFQPANGNGGFLTFGGPRAGGGPVSPGQAYLVGEQRPEIFVPNVPGKIIPRVGGAGGGTLVQVINNVPDTVTREERRTENGRETTRIYLDQTTARNMARSGTATRRTMETLGSRARLPTR